MEAADRHPAGSWLAVVAWLHLALLFAAVLTVSRPELWWKGGVACGILLLSLPASWIAVQRSSFGVSVPIAIPLALASIGLVQLLASVTLDRRATEWRILELAAVAASACISSQIVAADSHLLRNWRRAVAIGGTLFAGYSLAQYYTSGGLVYWAWDSGAARVLGPFVNYDHYASLMLLWVPIAFYEAVYHRRLRLIALGAVALMAGSAIAGGSRAGTGLMAAVLVVGVLHAISGSRGVGAVWTLLVAIGGVLVAGWELVFLRFQLPDLWVIRREFYESSLRMIADHPLRGFGLGSWVKAYGRYGEMDVGSINPNAAHNDWLQFGAEQGLLADGLLACLLIWVVLRSRQRLWGVGVAAVLVHCAVDFPLQILPIALWAGAIAGTLEAEPGSGRRSRARRRAADSEKERSAADRRHENEPDAAPVSPGRARASGD